jgi:transcriptional regulator with XRE-family HTH domain
MPQSGQRYRKTAILAPQGLQKLEAAKSAQSRQDHPFQTYTLEALSERTALSTHTLSKIHSGRSGVDLRTLVRYFEAFNLTLEPEDYIHPSPRSTSSQPDSDTAAIKDVCSVKPLFPVPRVSWGLAPDLSRFYGRTTELATLVAQNTPVSFLDVRSHISSVISSTDLLEAVNALKMRSHLDRTATQLTLPPFLRDYIHEQLVTNN